MNIDAAAGRYLTEIASKLIWIRQQKLQAEQLQQTCANMLNDLREYPDLQDKIKDFVAELSAAESEQFDNWSREVIQNIEDPNDSIALETRGKLMILEKEQGILKVNYSDRLVGFFGIKTNSKIISKS